MAHHDGPPRRSALPVCCSKQLQRVVVFEIDGNAERAPQQLSHLWHPPAGQEVCVLHLAASELLFRMQMQEPPNGLDALQDLNR